jgi:hypothetical protein
METEHSPVCQLGLLARRRPQERSFLRNNPIQGAVSDCHHPLGFGSRRVCPLERRQISYRMTARPIASSKRACVRGPVPALTALQTSAQQSRLDGFIATLGTDLMAASAPSRPSPASHWAPMAEPTISPSQYGISCFGRGSRSFGHPRQAAPVVSTRVLSV